MKPTGLDINSRRVQMVFALVGFPVNIGLIVKTGRSASDMSMLVKQFMVRLNAYGRRQMIENPYPDRDSVCPIAYVRLHERGRHGLRL